MKYIIYKFLITTEKRWIEFVARGKNWNYSTLYFLYLPEMANLYPDQEEDFKEYNEEQECGPKLPERHLNKVLYSI